MTSTTLTKFTSFTYTPGLPGSPGSPGTPAQPAYTYTITLATGAWVRADGFTLQTLPAGSGLDIGGRSGGIPWYWVSTGTNTYTFVVPAQLAVPASPAVPATPSSFTQNFNLGWTGRANSIAAMFADGSFTFTIPLSNVGSVTGLATTPQTSGYADILFGWQSAHGVATVYESGAQVYSYGAHTAANVFKIRRRAGKVDYLVDSMVAYTSTAAANTTTMFLTTSLYSGGDAIVGAAYSGETVAANSFVPLDAQSGYAAYTAGIAVGSMSVMTGTAVANATSAYALMVAPAAVAGIAAASAIGSLSAIYTTMASSFSTPGYALANGVFSFFESYGHSLTGQLGTSTGNSFLPLDSLASRGASSLGIASFLPLTELAYTFEAPTQATIFSFGYITGALDARLYVFLVMNSAGTVTGTMTVQTLMDASAMSAALATASVSGQLTISALMTSLANASNISFDDGVLTAWVMNVANSGTSRYTGYGFNSFAKIGKDFYGVKADGLYKLTGVSDAGAAIAAAVNLGKSDFGTSRLKSITQAYFGVASNGFVVLKVVADGTTYYYTARDNSTTLGTQRADTGRGFRANYFELEVQNTAGGAFELSTIEFTPIPLSRRI
jgi:hypothetical protein